LWQVMWVGKVLEMLGKHLMLLVVVVMIHFSVLMLKEKTAPPPGEVREAQGMEVRLT